MDWKDIELSGQVFANGYEDDLTHSDLVQVIFKHLSDEYAKNGEVPFDVKYAGLQDKDQIRHCETFCGLIATLAWILAYMFPVDTSETYNDIARLVCKYIADKTGEEIEI